MVHVEEGEPFDGAAQDDEEGVQEFKHLGEVEDVGPEEEGTSWFSVGREAED